MADEAREFRDSACPERTIHAATAVAIMAAILGLDGQLGPLSFVSRRAISLSILAAVALLVLLRSEQRRIIPWAGVLVGLVLVARAPAVPISLVAFLVVIAVTEGIADPGARATRFPAAVISACLAYVGFRFVSDLVPQTGAIAQTVAQLASRYISVAQGAEARLSFSALGGPTIGLAVLYLLGCSRRHHGVVRATMAAILPLAWFAILPAVTPDATTGPIAAFARGAWHGLFWLILAVVVDAVAPRKLRVVALNTNLLPLAAACLAAGFAGVCLVGTALIGPAAGKSILVHNRGGLDWDRPVFGRFGVFSGGMFGQLPVYCRAEGYEFGVIDKDKIAAADLVGTQILVLINSPKVWKDEERQSVLDFVAKGGSLLVLGDHTDVFGLMRGFNTLLGPLGIKFRFDSAFKARETWRGCQVAAPDAVAWGWDQENPGVAVGASLELGGNARPLLVGRYGFSDAGIRENVVGSFLGNYHYDRGERLGDVVLVATATHGRGRVVVWGDTSAFQGGLSSSYRTVVGPTLAWLSRPAAWTEQPAVRLVAAIALLAVLLWSWIVSLGPKPIAGIIVSLLVGLAVPWALSLGALAPPAHVDRDTFLIDRSHMEATGHYEARINPISPLYTNLLRSGFRILDMDDWDQAAVGRARGVAFVAPQKPLSRGEVEELLRAEEGGAVVILTTGEPDSVGSRPLLDAHGLALLPRPMGAVTPVEPTASRREHEQQPRFPDAWPIVAAGEGDPAALPGVEVIYRQGDDVVALFRRVGRGGLLVISDTRFFSDMNVEDMSGYWLGNLALIHDMFQHYLGADPEAVKPLFRSPEKPR